MAKDIDVKLLREMLFSSKVGEKRKAIKLIAQNKLHEFNEDIFNFLQNTINENKFWESHVQIIDYLGYIKFKPLISILESICNSNEPHSMVTMVSSRALCRIKRTNDNDVSEVMKLLSYGNFSVINGALKSLGQDKIIPSKNEIKIIIENVNKIEAKQEKGYADIRVGLALACAGWEKTSLVMGFLNNCIESNYSPLQKVASNSIKGKYTNID